MKTGWEYKPKSNNEGFLTLKQKNEQIKIRIVSDPYIFKEGYTNPTGETIINEKFAVVCIDRADGKVKSFKGGMQIFKAIQKHIENEDWGDPKTYDFTITRTEEKPNYYSVMASPKKSELTEEEIAKIKETQIDLAQRYSKYAIKSDENIEFLNENSRNNDEDIPF